MATSVVMPALELAQETGKVVAWRKQEGEAVRKGEPLLDIETDKAVVEVESPGDGQLAGVIAHVGDEVVVGKVIAWLLAPGEAVPTSDTATQTGRTGGASVQTSASAPAAAAAGASAGLGGAPRLSPKARRLAQENGVDLSLVPASGPGGEILAGDIQAFIEARATTRDQRPPATGDQRPATSASVSTIWKLMAERTAQSWSTVPHFFLARDVDASALVAQRAPLKERGVTYTDFLVALVARVLARHPRVNASWTGGTIALNPEIHVGVAVASDEGVVVAVVRNAATSTVEAIARERQAIAERARTGKAKPTDLAGATFTISNLGMRRVDAFTAIINPPQAAILAVGSIVDRVVAVGGQPAVRPMLTMTMSSDHRVIDGARAAAFMDDVASAIGDPESWLK